MHRIYKHPGNGFKIKSSAGVLAKGVDVKGDGGMFVAPPSLRPDVGLYRWLNDAPIVDAPDWLLALVQEEKAAGAGERREERFRKRPGRRRKIN